MVPEDRSSGDPVMLIKVTVTVFELVTDPVREAPCGTAWVKPTAIVSPKAAPVTVTVVPVDAPEAVEAGSQVVVAERCLRIRVPLEPMVTPPSATKRSLVLRVSAADLNRFVSRVAPKLIPEAAVPASESSQSTAVPADPKRIP